MATAFAIEATGLTKSYDGAPVVRAIDLQVPAGAVCALLGPNGAGKTTIVRMLATLTSPDSGSGRVAGFDVATQAHLVRRSISLTGQFVAIDEPQTGEENLRMMGRLCGLSGAQARARARDLLAEFDLTDAARKRVAAYSGGMRRRLDLACSLVGRPSVVFLDEPTTGLDPRSRRATWDLIAGLVKSGVSVLLTTQYLDEADRLADRIAVIDHGRVVAEGTPSELKSSFAGQRLDLMLRDRAAYDVMLARLGADVISTDSVSHSIGVPTDGTARQVRAVLDELDPARTLVTEFAVRTATLDDVFLALTGRGTDRTEATSSV